MAISPKPSAFEDRPGLTQWKWDAKSRRYLIKRLDKVMEENSITAKFLLRYIKETLDTDLTPHESEVSRLRKKYVNRDNEADNLKYTKIYLWLSIKYPDDLSDYPEDLLPDKCKKISAIVGDYREFENISHEIQDHSTMPTSSYHLPDEIRVHEQSRARDNYDAGDSNNDGFSMNFEGKADNSGRGKFKVDLKYFSKMPNIAIILGVVIVAALLLGYSRNSITTTGDCSPGSISGSNSGIEINCK